MSEQNWYWTGYYLFWFLIFVGSWIYCASSYGFLIGVGIGWLPSIIVAGLASLLRPAYIVIGIIIGIYAM